MFRALRFLPLFLAATPAVTHAQEEVQPLLTGSLMVSGMPADTGTVVLHRITPEEAGNIDSTAVDPDGGFVLRLPSLPIPGSGEVFLASSRYDGVLYAGAPISEPGQLDSLYAIRAFPSEPAPPEGFAFPISRREVWIDEGPIGWQVTDVLEIRNPQPTTVIPFAEEAPVWRYPLPAGAIGGRVLQVGPVVGPARVDSTTLTASNPVIPRENYYIVQYDLESIEFDLPLPGETGLVQVMVREPSPAIRVEGLARQPSEEIEVGVTFMRWAGQSLRDQRISIRLGEAGGVDPLIWMSGALALVLVAAGSFVIRARPTPTTASPAVRTRRDLLVEVARLDEEYSRLKEPSSKAKARYRRRRAALVGELEVPGPGGASDRK